MESSYRALEEALVRQGGGELGQPSKADLQAALDFGFPPELLDLYSTIAPNAPAGCIELEQRLWSIERAIEENHDYVPGSDLFPIGYVVFASTLSGDAYCLDTRSADSHGHCPVVLFPHEAIPEHASRDDVQQYRLEVASTLAEFIERFADGTLIDDPRYE